MSWLTSVSAWVFPVTVIDPAPCKTLPRSESSLRLAEVMLALGAMLVQAAGTGGQLEGAAAIAAFTVIAPAPACADVVSSVTSVPPCSWALIRSAPTCESSPVGVKLGAPLLLVSVLPATTSMLLLANAPGAAASEKNAAASTASIARRPLRFDKIFFPCSIPERRSPGPGGHEPRPAQQMLPVFPGGRIRNSPQNQRGRGQRRARTVSESMAAFPAASTTEALTRSFGLLPARSAAARARSCLRFSLSFNRS